MAAEADDDEDKSRMVAGREFQAAGPQTVKLCDTKSTEVAHVNAKTLCSNRPSNNNIGHGPMDIT